MDGGAIARARADFVDALRGGDAVAASVVYAEDAKLLAPSAEVFAGRAAIAAFWRAGLDAGISGIELEELTTGGGEGVAWEIGRYALHLEPADGQSVVDRGKYLVVHQLQEDGSWRWAVEMFSPDASQRTPQDQAGTDPHGIARELQCVRATFTPQKPTTEVKGQST